MMLQYTQRVLRRRQATLKPPVSPAPVATSSPLRSNDVLINRKLNVVYVSPVYRPPLPRKSS